MTTTPTTGAEMPEALRLADALDRVIDNYRLVGRDNDALAGAAAELRRLHAISAEAPTIKDCLMVPDGATAPAAPAEGIHDNAEKVKPMFWVRLCSDGGYEGPLHDDRIEHVRKLSGAWYPLYLGAAPQAQQPGAADATVPQVVATAPRRIYLDLGFDPAEEDAPFSELHEITWSANNASGHGVEYVRADLAARAGAQAVPVKLDHLACVEDGVLRYMSGRKAPDHDCELYAMPGGGRAPELYAAPAAVSAPSDDTRAASLPSKVTPDMRRIFREAFRSGGFWGDRLDYALEQMLAAAPQAPAQEGGAACSC